MTINAGQWVKVTCRAYSPFVGSAHPDGYWYKIDSAPNNQYWAAANTFMNGQSYSHPKGLSGTPTSGCRSVRYQRILGETGRFRPEAESPGLPIISTAGLQVAPERSTASTVMGNAFSARGRPGETRPVCTTSARRPSMTEGARRSRRVKYKGQMTCTITKSTRWWPLAVQH